MIQKLQTARALFVTHRSHLTGRGGVQACSQEYLRALAAANVDVDVMEILHDDALLTRAARRLNSSPYFRSVRADYLKKISSKLASDRHDFLFFNQVALSSSARALSGGEGRFPIKIALSHGCEVTDMLHAARIEKALPLSARLRPSSSLALGNTLFDEMKARRDLDGVVTLSPSDMETERWLGAKHVTWLPRTIAPNPIRWAPEGEFFGYVGTLDHAPNLEGLVSALDVAGPTPPFRVQVIGGPSKIGSWLSARFAFVDYLGALEEDALLGCAARWRAFIHPIFCPARGCSTKLATALAWGIPIITTRLGRRGYTWSEGSCIEADTPDAFFAAMCSLLEKASGERAREEALKAAGSAPSLEAVGDLLRSFLAHLRSDTQEGSPIPVADSNQEPHPVGWSKTSKPPDRD